jgi:RNA polymerase sigma-70 factor (ECF subfamily)
LLEVNLSLITGLDQLTKEEFKVLFDTYFNSVRSYLFYRGAEKEQASDLAQDVFLRIWEKQLDIEPKTVLRLVYKIANDMFISQYRRENLNINYRKSLKKDTSDISPEEKLQYDELFQNYTKALADLPEKQRTGLARIRKKDEISRTCKDKSHVQSLD